MKNALAIIARGFLLGLGFSVAAVAVMAAAQAYWMQQYSSGAASSTPAALDTFGEDARKDIVLSDVEEQKADGRVAVIGNLKNTGSRPLRGLHVEVDLFHKGKFVDQYSTYISGTIGPGESRHFKVTCGCNNTPPAEHDSFKAQLRGGF